MAATTTEHVGLAAAIALLAGALAIGAGGGGAPVGDAVGARLDQLVTGEGRSRIAREQRREGGEVPQRVPRDQLRMTPIVDPVAAWQRRWARDARIAGVDARIDTRACVLCTGLEWSHELRSGGALGSGGDAHTGLEAGIDGAARLALASIDASVRAQRTLGPARIEAQARARGIVGTEAEARAQVRASRSELDVELGGSAMAGAAAKAEGRVGVELLGIAIEQSGRAEGWAGAGARGMVGFTRDAERVDWRVGWGVALGLGGATEWRGSVDVSRVPRRHRALARASLTAAVRAALGPAAGITAFAPAVLATDHGAHR